VQKLKAWLSGIAVTQVGYWVHELKKPDGTTRVYLMFPIDQLQGAGTRGLSHAGANSG
jgi:hypothetical protein